jgi:hypothetical protein
MRIPPGMGFEALISVKKNNIISISFRLRCGHSYANAVPDISAGCVLKTMNGSRVIAGEPGCITIQ